MSECQWHSPGVYRANCRARIRNLSIARCLPYPLVSPVECLIIDAFFAHREFRTHNLWDSWIATPDACHYTTVETLRRRPGQVAGDWTRDRLGEPTFESNSLITTRPSQPPPPSKAPLNGGKTHFRFLKVLFSLLQFNFVGYEWCFLLVWVYWDSHCINWWGYFLFTKIVLGTRQSISYIILLIGLTG